MASKKHHRSRTPARRQLGRTYPPIADRKQICTAIEAMPEAVRTPADWYTLGSLLVYEATLEDDDIKLNRGTDALLRSADAVSPDPEAFLELTWVLLYRGLDALALKYAIKATETQPWYRDTWALRAWVHIGQAQRSEAIASLERAVTLPDSIPGDAHLLDQLRTGHSLEALRKDLVLRHASVELLLGTASAGDEATRNLIFALRQMLKIQPDDPKILYNLASAYYQIKEYERIELFLARLLAVSGTHVEGLVLKALVCAKLGREDEAMGWYETALTLQPTHVLANTNRVVPLLAKKEFKTARIFVQAALDGKGPAEHRARALDQMGTILCESDHDYKNSLRFHAEAVDLAPRILQFQVNHLISLIQANDRHGLKKYWGRYRKFLSTQPEADFACSVVTKFLDPISDPRHCLGLAETLAPLLDWHAVGYFIREAWDLIHKVPDDAKPGFCADAGMMAGRTGQDELALQFFAKGEEFDEPGGPLSLNCAVALADLGRMDEALAKAGSCDPDQPRALTILGNILKQIGRHGEAVDAYLRAIEIDKDFLLPVENGVHCAIFAWRTSAIRQFVNIAQERWPEDHEAQAIAAYGLGALGLHGEAVKEFFKVFVTHDGFHVPTSTAQATAKPETGEEDEDPAGETSGPTDLTVEPLNTGLYLLNFGYSLLHSGQFQMLQELFRWVWSQADIRNGDWRALQAESLRSLLIKTDLMLSELEPLGSQPPSAATKALYFLAENQPALAREAAAAGLAPEYEGRSFNHALGDPKAICMAAIGLADVADGLGNSALDWSQRAIDLDKACPVGWLAKARALSALIRNDEAIAVAGDGLRHSPGDPDLYEWHQEKCLQEGRLDLAKLAQEEMQEALFSRQKHALFYALQARVADARFDEPATHVRMLIRAGEGTALEFKSTLRLNVRAGKHDDEMTYACLKTIAAFLNTHGGTLLIGVADDGRVVGIEQDGFANDDRFLQHFSNKILSSFGEVAASHIESRIHKLDDLTVCEVACTESKVPVYLRSKGEEEFYVRTGPRSDRLPHSKFLEYARIRFSF